MSFYRSRKENKKYDGHLLIPKKVGCVFCAAKKGYGQCIERYKYCKVLKNRFPYSIWDGQRVMDHLMIVPNKHTDSIGDFSKDEILEYMKVIGEYEEKGYSIYARTPSSTVKSVVHQHTHLIKNTGKDLRLILYIAKPFLARWIK
jgi:diadenosine tetraphosphate (Ap4A) HIT family hydrolase